MPWPSMAEVVNVLTGASGDQTDEQETTDETAQQTPPPAGDRSEADPEKTEETGRTDQQANATSDASQTESEPASDANAIADAIRDELKRRGADPKKAAESLVKELPEDVIAALGSPLYPGMQRVLAQRDRLFDQRLEQTKDQLRGEIRTEFEQKLDELITSGMSDEDAEAYRARQKLAKLENAEKDRQKRQESQSAEAAVVRSAINQWWSIVVNEGGLPPDPEDPRVRALWEATFDEPDFARAQALLRQGLAKIKSPTKPNQNPGGSADPELLAELVAKGVEAELKKRGLFHADTGRPGSSGAEQTKKPKTLGEASAMAIERLKQRR